MKYLKRYKIFETNSENIRLDIEDIIYDLEEDEGFDNYVSKTNSIGGLRYQIRIIKKDLSEGFYFNEVKDIIDRLVDYFEPYESNRASHVPQNKLSFQINFFDSKYDSKLMAAERFDLSYDNMLKVLRDMVKYKGSDDLELRAIYIQIDIKE